jgi:hypothetical protein
MKTCPWCEEKIHPKMGDICVSCWALKTRIEKHPDIAKRMLASITGCAFCDLFNAKGLPCECGRNLPSDIERLPG